MKASQYNLKNVAGISVLLTLFLLLLITTFKAFHFYIITTGIQTFFALKKKDLNMIIYKDLLYTISTGKQPNPNTV